MKSPMFLHKNKSVKETNENVIEDACDNNEDDTLVDNKKTLDKKKDNYSIIYKDVIVKKSY